MEPRYRVVYTQGQGAVRSELMLRTEARDAFLSTLGQCSLGVEKDNKLLTFEQACDEFDINEDIANKIIKLQMRINSLYAKLTK